MKAQTLHIENPSKELLEFFRKLRAEKEQLEETTTQLTRKEIINTLLEDLPEKYVETVSEFISAAGTDEEIYERFNTIISIIEAKEEKEDEEEEKPKKKKGKKNEDEDDDEEEELDDEEEEEDEEESEDEEDEDEDNSKKSKNKSKKEAMDESLIFESSTTNEHEDEEGLTKSELDMLKMIGLL